MGRNKLQRLFSTFPDGWPGVGLLLLRAAVGAAAVIQGGSYLVDSGNLTFWRCVVGLSATLAGASILLGFLTPVVGGLLAIVSAAVSLSWLPSPARNLFGTPVPTAFVAVLAAAVACLGPGALSVDARLFGRREIIIPRTSRSEKP
jgi:uncharacterized membrane protein YphA (DoxX/SURF4 family)